MLALLIERAFAGLKVEFFLSVVIHDHLLSTATIVMTYARLIEQTVIIPLLPKRAVLESNLTRDRYYG